MIVNGTQRTSLYLTKPISKLFPTENYPVVSFRVVLMQDLLDGLHTPSLDVIKMDEVGLTSRLDHMKVADGTLTAVGKKRKDRCLLEVDHRFAGNESEELTGSDVEISDNDGLCTLLDPRTNNCKHLEGQTSMQTRREAVHQLR